MCVIIIKPAGVKMPSNNTLRNAYLANPHGCGFASTNHVFKSLNYAAFIDHLAAVDDSEACIIHFRLATHGSIKRSNCHPFVKNDVYFAHNGILDIQPIGDKTDSETAFIKYIYPTIKNYGLNSAEVDYVINRMIGFSKFAIMRSGSREVKTYGCFIEQPDGCLYSNLRFLTVDRRYSKILHQIY